MKQEHTKTLKEIVRDEQIRADLLTGDAKHCYLGDFEHLEPAKIEGVVHEICDYGSECPFQAFDLKEQKDYCTFHDQYNKSNYKVFMVRMGYLNK